MDVGSLPYGVDFVERINNEVASCKVMVVASLRDRSGRRRLAQTDDVVRAEVASHSFQRIKDSS
jgi:hypothetical protein